jgi:hypothetical protein
MSQRAAPASDTPADESDDMWSHDEVTQVVAVVLPPSNTIAIPGDDTVVAPLPLPPAPEPAGKPWPEEHPVVAPWPEQHPVVAVPDQPTVIAPLAPSTRPRDFPPPKDLTELFAEPPRAPQRSGPAQIPDTPATRKRKRRRLLLLFTIAAGAWVTLGPAINRPRRTTGKLHSVRAAFAPVAPQPNLVLPKLAEPPTLASATGHLEADRYEQALVQYRALAKLHSNEEVYAVIADVVTRRIVDQCREQEDSICQWP